MPHISRKQVATIAAHFGHRDLEVKQTVRGLWVATCICGFRSTQRRTAADAASAAGHHMMLVVRAWETAGRPPLPLRTAIPEGKGSLEPAAALRAS